MIACHKIEELIDQYREAKEAYWIADDYNKPTAPHYKDIVKALTELKKEIEIQLKKK